MPSATAQAENLGFLLRACLRAVNQPRLLTKRKKPTDPRRARICENLELGARPLRGWHTSFVLILIIIPSPLGSVAPRHLKYPHVPS